MATSTWFLLAVTAAYGLVIGSFLNVVIHRLPRGQSLLRPRSNCPACGAAIAWFDNVPALSYLLLGGRCRRCRAPISARYPLVELAAAGLLVAVTARFGLTVAGLAAALLVLLLLALALIDLEHHLLLDVLTLPGLAVALLLAPLGGSLVGPLGGTVLRASSPALSALASSLLGAAVGALVPYAVIVAYRLIRGGEGMGLGDVKFLAMIGAFLGWKGVLLTIGLGSVVGAAVGLALIAAGRGRRDTELPFGTFLAAGALLTLFAGAQLMRVLGWIRP
jgi:leader peptidase (prepilin peptidase)/N-methyltransferase